MRHPMVAILALLAVVFSLANFLLIFGEAGQRVQSNGVSILVTHPLGMLAGGYLLFAWVFPRAIGRAGPDTARRVEQARASGPALAETWCGARLGRLSLRGPLLRVTVYPGGIVFRPILMAARAILAPELVSVEGRRGFFAWGLMIHHDGPDIGSPVRLRLGDDSPAARAIRSLLRPQPAA